MKRFFSLVVVLISTTIALAGELSDSLPIEGHYSQAGRLVSRFKLERFLLEQNSSSELADRSLGNKWSGHAVGALLWSVDLGIAVYEFKQLYDAIQNQSVIINAAGKREPFSNRLYTFAVPLTIGTEAVSFVQARLYSRSDYLLHEAALSYDESLARKSLKKLDLHIENKRSGGYAQAGLVFYESSLYSILTEQPASAGLSAWSWGLKETSVQVGTWGATFLGLAVVSYLQQYMGDTSFAIDSKARKTNLTIGISLTTCSIVSAIVSAVIRKKAIMRYNEALADPKAD